MGKKSSHFAYDFIRDKEENRILQCCSLYCALRYFLLRKKNYTAISSLYSAMDLFDNSELLRLLHSEGRGSGAWLDSLDIHEENRWENAASWAEKGSSAGLSFSDVIYEDILKLAAVRIVDRHDEQLRKLVELFASPAAPASDREGEDARHLYALFLCLYDREKEPVPYPFARDFYKSVFGVDSGEGKRLKMTFFEMMLSISGGDFSQKEDFVERTADDMVRQIAKAFGVGPVRVYNEIRRFHPASIARLGEGESLRRLTGLTGDLIRRFHIPMSVLGASAAQWSARKIYSLLCELCASYYPDAVRRQKNECPSQTGRPELKYFPPVFLVVTELYYLLMLDCALSSISALQEDYYRNFNFDRINDMATISQMKKKIADLQEENEAGKRNIDQLKSRLKKSEQEREALLKGSELERYGQHSGEQKKIEELEAENALLRRQRLDQDEYIRLLEEPQPQIREQPPVTEEMTALLQGQRILFVGGTVELGQALKRTFRSAVFVTNETSQVSMSGIDRIVMFVKFMSHALYYKYIEAAREMGIPVVYCNVNNYAMVVRIIYESCVKEK